MVDQKFMDQFKHHNIEFTVDEISRTAMEDKFREFPDMMRKFKRNYSNEFYEWIQKKLKSKENVSVNIKGDTRGGKSIGALALVHSIIKIYGKKFDTEWIVCGNQREYRLKLGDDKLQFGDVFQIDENAFNSVGLGSHSEMQQLKDIQNIIAKRNIHTFYITPRTFLDTGAMLGLHAYGKDKKNWLTKFLLFDLRLGSQPLIGYVIVDVGKLFRENGCYVYKETGGCTNPERKSKDQISKEAIEHSSCISSEKLVDAADNPNNCPFYNYCKSPLNVYEKKKDKWIEGEMEGRLDERTLERYRIGLELFKLYGRITPEGKIGVASKNAKTLKLKVQLSVKDISNVKLTGAELDEVVALTWNLSDRGFMESVCKELNVNSVDVIENLEAFDETSKA